MEGFWILFTAGRAQMRKVNTIAEGFNHPHQVVIRPHAVGAGTHGKAVVDAVDRLFQPLHIFNRRHDTRQAEDRTRRIVRMYRQANPHLFRDRHNCAQEVRHVFTQLLLINIAVFRQAGAELIQRIPLFGTRQARNNITGQLFDVCVTGGVKPRARLLLLFRGVIRFCARAFQNVQFECRKGNLIETQRF